MIGQDETLGDLRDRRDPPADGALKARLADPEKAAQDDASAAERNAALAAEQRDAILGATERRIQALEAKFGDWAVVADVLISEGLDGDDLESELAECQSEAKTAAEWMRQNF